MLKLMLSWLFFCLKGSKMCKNSKISDAPVWSRSSLALFFHKNSTDSAIWLHYGKRLCVSCLSLKTLHRTTLHVSCSLCTWTALFFSFTVAWTNNHVNPETSTISPLSHTISRDHYKGTKSTSAACRAHLSYSPSAASQQFLERPSCIIKQANASLSRLISSLDSEHEVLHCINKEEVWFV